MTSCERLSERMVAVARGESVWSAEESAHVAECRECALEWQMVSATAGLGQDLPAIDADRISKRLRTRLASGEQPADRRRSGIRWGRWSIGLAAAAVLVLAVGVGQRGSRPPVAVAETRVVLSELDELDSKELEVVLSEMDGAGSLPDDGVGLGDLTSDELERLLRSWEG